MPELLMGYSHLALNCRPSSLSSILSSVSSGGLGLRSRLLPLLTSVASAFCLRLSRLRERLLRRDASAPRGRSGRSASRLLFRERLPFRAAVSPRLQLHSDVAAPTGGEAEAEARDRPEGAAGPPPRRASERAESCAATPRNASANSCALAWPPWATEACANKAVTAAAKGWAAPSIPAARCT